MCQKYRQGSPPLLSSGSLIYHNHIGYRCQIIWWFPFWKINFDFLSHSQNNYSYQNHIIMAEPDQKDHQETGRVYFKPSPLEKIIMLFLLFISALLFIFFVLKIVHYCFIPFPRLFSSPTLDQSFETQSHYLYNAFLYSLFFVQHVVMALTIFKKAIISFVPRYFLYERYIYNIFSSWNVRPLALQSQIVLEIPIQIAQFLRVVGIVGLIVPNLAIGGIFNPFPIKRILSGKDLFHQGYDSYSTMGMISTGAYSICRNPMQASVMILLLVASNRYTIDRIIFIMVHLLGIVIGVLSEERRLIKKFKHYQEYMKKVPYRLIPYVY